MKAKILESISAVPVEVSKETPGRFTIITSPVNAQLTFVLDTASGRTWQLYRPSENVHSWRPIFYADPDESFDAMLTALVNQINSDAEPQSVLEKTKAIAKVFGEIKGKLVQQNGGAT